MPKFLDGLYQRVLVRMIGKRPVAANLGIQGGIYFTPDQRGVIICRNRFTPSKSVE